MNEDLNNTQGQETSSETQEVQNPDFDFANRLDEFLSKDKEQEVPHIRGSFKGTHFERLATTEEDEKDLDTFFTKDKLFIVFTHAGKPIYQSYGDIYHFSSIIATLYAIISKVQTISLSLQPSLHQQVVQDERLSTTQQVSEEKPQESQPAKSSSSSFSRKFKSIFEKKDKKSSTFQAQPVLLDNPITNSIFLSGHEELESIKNSKVCYIGTQNNRIKVAFLYKGDSLIYMGITKDPNESQTFLKKQLEILHLQLISITTQNMPNTLKLNPSYDVVNEYFIDNNLMSHQIMKLSKDPFTFLNQYLPLRIHPKTRDAIDFCVKKYKPISEKLFFGIILAQRTVVAIIKEDSKIQLVPADINVIFNYLNTYKDRLRKDQPCFENICFPGMTEDYKLNMFVHMEEKNDLKMIFVSEDGGTEFMQELEGCCVNVFEEFDKLQITDTIIQCESQMFQKLNLKEVLNTVISNQILEQYTCYNLPLHNTDELNPINQRSLLEYEKLYDRYQVSQNKKDLLLKKVYALETYALFATNGYVIMATIAQNRTDKDAREVCWNIYEDAKLDEQSCFIHKWN